MSTKGSDRDTETERAPPESVVAVTTEDGAVVYDRERSDAWISSTVARPIADCR